MCEDFCDEPVAGVVRPSTFQDVQVSSDVSELNVELIRSILNFRRSNRGYRCLVFRREDVVELAEVLDSVV